MDIGSTAINIPIIDASLREVEVQVPAQLKPIFEVNMHLLPRFLRAAKQAVAASFMHKDTMVRGDIRVNEVKGRYRILFAALHEMYYEQGLGMIRCCDVMEIVLLQAIREGINPTDLMESQANTTAWGLPGHEQREVAEDELFGGEAD